MMDNALQLLRLAPAAASSAQALQLDPLAFAPLGLAPGQPSHITANLLPVSTAHTARAWTAPGTP